MRPHSQTSPRCSQADTLPKVEVAEHPVNTPSQATAKQAVPTTIVKAPTAPTAQLAVAPTTPNASTQQKTPAYADVQQTSRADVTPCQSACTVKAPQHLIEQMYIQL